MKNYLAAILSQFFTALAGAGACLAGLDLIDQADVAKVDAAGVSLGAALAIILAAVIGHLVTRKFSMGKGSGGSGGAASLLLWAGTAVGFMGGLPSCSPVDRAAAWAIVTEIPIRSCVTTDYGTVCYSSKSGLAVTVDAKSGK